MIIITRIFFIKLNSVLVDLEMFIDDALHRAVDRYLLTIAGPTRQQAEAAWQKFPPHWKAQYAASRKAKASASHPTNVANKKVINSFEP